jgi:hypothetical protein
MVHRTSLAAAAALVLTFPGLAQAAPADGGQGPRTFAREELPGPPVPEEVRIPPGSRSDLLLWKQALDWQNDLLMQRGQGQALVRKFRHQRLDARLAALVEAAPAPDRQRLHEVRRRLGFEWQTLADLLARPWGVNARLSCRAQCLDLEGAMYGLPGTIAARGLPQARLELSACLQKVTAILVPLRKGNQAVIAAMADADAALAGAPQGPGASAGRP